MRHFGKYRLIRTLGEGAYGRVQEAVMQGPMGFEKRVALKLLQRASGSGDFGGRLAHEARVGALLQHPNVAAILEFGSVKGQYYLAMEYVDGASLEEVLQAARLFGKLPPPAAVVEIGRQVCAGLAHVHGAVDLSGRPLGLVHRDIKPSNLMLSRAGLVKILDFGIARAEADNVSAMATSTGVIRGTLQYLSPEQVDIRATVSPRSDLFSLGVVIYELLTGSPLFEGSSVPVVLNQIGQDVPETCYQRVRAVSPGMEPILRCLLARDPEQRYASAAEAEQVLAALARQQPLAGGLALALEPWMPRCTRTLRTAKRETRRSRGVVAWAILALALLAGGGSLYLLVQRRGEVAAPPVADPRPATTESSPPADLTPAVPQEAPVLPVAAPAKVRGPRPRAPEPAVFFPEEGSAVEEALAVGEPLAAEEPPVPAEIAAPGSVTLGFRPFAEVFIDGESIGDRNRLSRYALPGGAHSIALLCAQYQPPRRKTFAVEIDGDEEHLGCWDFITESSCEVAHAP